MIPPYKIGIDVGGTFTDFLLADAEGNFRVFKVLSTPRDPSIGVLNGLKEMASSVGLSPAEFAGQIEIVVHGTTVTTNATLTGRGAAMGLLTTAGFRDALEMRRGLREELYDNKYQPPKPLVPRYLRLPVEERVDYTGEVRKPLDIDGLLAGLEELRQQGVEAIAICFLHSYANPTNEDAAGRIVRERFPSAYVTVSSEILPQVRFYDRVSTTCLNSYVGPILRGYLTSLTQKLDEAGFRGVLLIMQSNGGVASPQVAIQQAASTLLSGPAGGPIAGLHYAAPLGYDDCITIDMGGTSFDAALVQDRTPVVTTEGKVNRYHLAIPMLDIHTIGAGGGSIAWIDDTGFLRVGPQSAGADPGPACYGKGGTLPTVTDADVVLGYLNPDYFLGGKMPLHAGLAERTIQEKVATPLGLDLIQAAAGMYQVINVNMAAGIREVSIRRGLDPREFPLVVAGGAGPVHAGMIALELEIPVVITPKESSIFCAAGMLLSDLRHDFVRTYRTYLGDARADRWRLLFAEMEQQARDLLAAEHIPSDRVGVQYAVDMRYAGQYHEVTVPVRPAEVTAGDFIAVADRFHQAHDRLYGYSLKEAGDPVELINLRLTALGQTSKPQFRPQPYCGEDGSKRCKGQRPVYLPREGQFRSIDVFDGLTMGFGNRVYGPAILEQPNFTLFVPPEYDVICDHYGSYVMYVRRVEATVLKWTLNEQVAARR